jgi:hypothetical protein
MSTLFEQVRSWPKTTVRKAIRMSSNVRKLVEKIS